jgi:lysophospholipase L1-like esterase
MKLFLFLILSLPLFAKPTLWIIGDSTVRNNTRGQEGWGDPLIELFDKEKISVINKAIGGRSSRSFLTQGRWDEILGELQQGDYVLIQFGHNDGGKMFEGDRPRASIKGNGDESKHGTVEMTGKEETVRSFGWYLRHYCQTAQQKGAIPIVCSLIPRNIRDQEGIIQPDTKTYAFWAEQAAKQTQSHFIPLNQLLSDRYNALTQEQVDAIFCGTDHTHTSYPGATFHAHVVADGIRELSQCDLATYLKKTTITLTLPQKKELLKPSQILLPQSQYGWLDPHGHSFGARLPEGNYEVRVTFHSPESAAKSWVKAEARRLMVAPTIPETSRSRTFSVNVRTPKISSDREIKLRRESDRTSPDWDGLLSLEFFPNSSEIESLSIQPTTRATTIYIAGDSTVTNQSKAPYAGWGQMLPAFFKPNIAIANHAESGRALYSFRGERRFEKILSQIQAGDYLFIQFGHNDQKDKSEGAGPFTSYKRDLEDYIQKTRAKQAHPILITPMERRRWKDNEPQQTLTDFAEAVRLVSKEQNVPLLDLHTMSLDFYRALGPDDSKKALVHYPAGIFPGQKDELKDDTHHSNYGAYQLARCIVESLRHQIPDLAQSLRQPNVAYSASKPDSLSSINIPSTLGFGSKPEGN